MLLLSAMPRHPGPSLLALPPEPRSPDPLLHSQPPWALEDRTSTGLRPHKCTSRHNPFLLLVFFSWTDKLHVPMHHPPGPRAGTCATTQRTAPAAAPTTGRCGRPGSRTARGGAGAGGWEGPGAGSQAQGRGPGARLAWVGRSSGLAEAAWWLPVAAGGAGGSADGMGEAA